MFELIPFDRHMRSMANYDPFRALDEMERGFFGGDSMVSAFRTDDIKLDVENDCLTISAERKLDNEEKKPNFVKRERFYGSYSRSFDVSGIDQEHIEAAYNDGVLTLTMPKKADTTPPTRRLEIK